MAASFFFYDLETSGFDPRSARIMQFAGQRTDMELNPIGDPVNELIKLTQDVLPSPEAILVTGITPQQTVADGLTEAEFLKLFYAQVVQPDTIFVGFNSVRFDDEFMRFLHWRNLYDPYEWAWTNNCSRWDILDLVRMTRALRPEGINWPVTAEGKPTNRLELLAKENGLDHDHAHDALSDVSATIAVAKLIRKTQPDLFNYLLNVRTKQAAAKLVDSGTPFVYTSGRYPSEALHTTAAVLLTNHPQPGSGLVYDLRFDPTPYLKMTVPQLVDAWRYTSDSTTPRLPVKTMKYNRCPAVAPLGVIKDVAAQERINLSLDAVAKHLAILNNGKETLTKHVLAALKQLNLEREDQQINTISPVDGRLYEKFISSRDKQIMQAIRDAKPEEFTPLAKDLQDERLTELVPLYKARNFPTSLDADERAAWEAYCHLQIFDGGPASKLAQYFDTLAALAETHTTSDQKFILEELQLYGQSIIPGDAAG